MAEPWLFAKAGEDLLVALPLPRVVRVLHRGSPDFSHHLPAALDVGRSLGRPASGAAPGILVLLDTGRAWLFEDAAPSAGRPWRYLPLPPACFAERPPWARALLWDGRRGAFLADPEALEALACPPG